MSDMRQMTQQGRRIEEGSFAIIDEEAGVHDFSPREWQIVRRVIHSTADFEFKTLTELHPAAVEAGIAALRAGAPIIVDVNMIGSGLNLTRLTHYGCKVHCFISDEDVIATAKANDSTRAIESMRKSMRLGLLDGAIVAIGNAPTALIEVARMIERGEARPALVVGVPVGFVSAAESKDEIAQLQVPYIVTKGRKGGSPIAVAILHALMYLAAEESPA
jgi:precorrin-8X/cobalt-precorrin-8 methylmutase